MKDWEGLVVLLVGSLLVGLVGGTTTVPKKTFCREVYERSYSAADTLAVTREFPYCAKYLGESDE